jgi:hypothetical protein
MTSTFAEQTKYPYIYRHCYWGQTPYMDTFDLPKEIIVNRNRFITHYGIKKNITNLKTRMPQRRQIANQIFALEVLEHKTCDHLELYDTGISVIGVISNYDADDRDQLAYYDHGFHRTDSLYAPDGASFVIQLFY